MGGHYHNGVENWWKAGNFGEPGHFLRKNVLAGCCPAIRCSNGFLTTLMAAPLGRGATIRRVNNQPVAFARLKFTAVVRKAIIS